MRASSKYLCCLIFLFHVVLVFWFAAQEWREREEKGGGNDQFSSFQRMYTGCREVCNDPLFGAFLEEPTLMFSCLYHCPLDVIRDTLGGEKELPPPTTNPNLNRVCFVFRKYLVVGLGIMYSQPKNTKKKRTTSKTNRRRALTYHRTAPQQPLSTFLAGNHTRTHARITYLSLLSPPRPRPTCSPPTPLPLRTYIVCFVT